MSAEISFYHALETDQENVLFLLLKKSLAQGKKSLIRTPSFEVAQALSEFLWQAQPNFILPHGLICEPDADKQPILISYHPENVNQADYLFFIGSVTIEDLDDFTRIIVIFDDRCPTTKAHMRQEYKRLKAQNMPLAYYQQQQGKWNLMTG